MQRKNLTLPIDDKFSPEQGRLSPLDIFPFVLTFGPDVSNHFPYHLQNSEKVTDISKFVVFEIHTSDIICKEKTLIHT